MLERDSEARRQEWVRLSLMGLSALCAASGAARLYFQIKNADPPDQQVVLFLATAAALLLADSITHVKFAGVEIQRLKDRLDELADVAKPTAGKLAGGATPSTSAGSSGAAAAAKSFNERVHEYEQQLYGPGLRYMDDPVAALEASAAAGGNSLTAVVTSSKNYAQAFTVTIRVMLSRTHHGVQGAQVAFLLHHSFSARVRRIAVQANKASLTVLSLGTFTAGAVLPDGTPLKLNLAESDLSSLSPDQRLQFLTS